MPMITTKAPEPVHVSLAAKDDANGVPWWKTG
jgi:hypothetical protein